MVTSGCCHLPVVHRNNYVTRRTASWLKETRRETSANRWEGFGRNEIRMIRR